MKIGDYDIGTRTLIIAEIGSNHCGDAELAHRSLLAAARSGVDIVKFQMYRPETLVDPVAPVLKYIAQTHKTQRERFQSLCLPPAVLRELAEMARRVRVLFMATPFDEEAVAFLDPLVPAFKIASGDLTNARLIDQVVRTGKPLLVSTGFATVEEIDWVVGRVPRAQLCLMHCVGAYPTPPDDVHLEAIRFLTDRYGVPVGFSDHTAGIVAVAAAVAKGARVIEKHVMLSRDLPTADVALSVTPEELADLVRTVRQVERMAGQYGKAVQPSEEYFRSQMRRSVYAARDLSDGQILTDTDLVPLRPRVSGGIDARVIENLVGQRLLKRVERGRPLYPELVEDAVGLQ